MQLLEDKAGAPLVEGGFWMDSIKTHCYATVEGQEAADRAIAALQGLQWPPQSFKRLEAKIGDVSAEEVREPLEETSGTLLHRTALKKVVPT